MSATSDRASDLRERFDHDGYVVLKGLLSPEEAAQYRDELKRLSGLTDADFPRFASSGGWALNDGVTTLAVFWPVIFHRRLLDAVRAVVGPDARYTQHSDLLVHAGQPAWHRDSADRLFGRGPDWDESRAPYRVARVAIYLQSYEESRSALGLIPGTHRRQSFVNSAELALWDKVNAWRKRRGKPTVLGRFLSMRPEWIKTDVGDCLIFNERILHSASKIDGPKYAIFLSYGADNEHSRRLRRFYMERKIAYLGPSILLAE